MLTKIGVPLGIAGAAGSASGVLSPSPRALVDGGGMLPLVVGGSRPVPSSGRYRGSVGSRVRPLESRSLFPRAIWRP
jgi:hypothetical protein